MAASSTIQNPATRPESKSGKKKKAKAADRTESPAPTVSPAPEKAGDDEGAEHDYIRELQKNIRNINKKIANTSKTDAVIAEYKDKDLDELVSLKIINADQKAQHLKKPALLQQLAQLEEQLMQFKKIDQEYKARADAEKAKLESDFAQKLEQEKAAAVSEAKEETESKAKAELHASLLIVSQFLRLAAARRQEEAESTSDENLALEGVLLAIYSGDNNAVTTMMKLLEGSAENTSDIQGNKLETTFAQVKAVATAYKPAYPAESQATEPEVEAAEAPEAPEAPISDPTLVHATMTEIDAGETALTNGHMVPGTVPLGSSNADAANEAANVAAESQWDAGNDMSMSISQEWIDVPRDPAETETGLTATPADAGNKQSWADDQPENLPEAPAEVASAEQTPADPNDGFHQVPTRNRGRGDRDGWRGRGRGEWRGSRGGYRGEGRGRGRGGSRRDGMPVRQRQAQE